MKIFGREPAAVIGAVEAAAVLVLTLNTFDLDSGQVAVVMSFVSVASGFITALFTRETTLAIVLGFVRAVIALGAGFGLPISDNTASAIMLAAPVVLQLWFRTQTVPLAKPSLKEGIVVQGEVLQPAIALPNEAPVTNTTTLTVGGGSTAGTGMPYPYDG